VRFCYALCESKEQGSIGQWYRTVLLLDVDPLATPMDELKQGLRAWGLATLTSECSRDGWYAAFLVESDGRGNFDTYDPIHVEDYVWCYGCEYVPAHEQLLS
jgi:hypothetical protein